MRMCGWEGGLCIFNENGVCIYQIPANDERRRCRHERSDSMGFSVGDNVTISGKVIEIKDSMLQVRTASGCEYEVKVEDVKTWWSNGTESQMSGVINVQY